MKRCWGFVLCSVLFFSVSTPAEASVLYLDPAEASINPGDTLVTSIRITPTSGQCINAIDGVVEYDPSIQPVDISQGESIFPLWVEEPTIDRENNRITFAGGIPNGYCGRIQGDPRLTNEVLKIVFQVPGMRVGFGDVSPTTTVRFSDLTSVYLNDGRGTLANLTTNSATYIVGTRVGDVVRNDWVELVSADERIPEEFSIALQRDEKVFADKYYIVFNTTDKQTGIAYYEVIEEPLEEAGLFGWGAANAPWQKTRSPYVLQDQTLNSTIRVKAVDKAGNEYIATLVPDESLRGVSLTTIIEYIIIGVGILTLVGVVVGLLWFSVPRILGWMKRRREERAEETDEEYEYVEEWVEVEVDEDGNPINHDE